MAPPNAPSLEQYHSALDALRSLATDVAHFDDWSDADLLEATRLHAEGSRVLGAAGAALAGQITFRSRPELGANGLARRTGHPSVNNLLKTATGGTKEQVMTAVAAGILLVESANEGKYDAATGEVFTATQPWMKPVAAAVAAGSISTSASSSIGRGLGTPNSAVSRQQLELAAQKLVDQAIAGVDADKLLHNARDLRADLNFAGVKLQETELRGMRGLTHHATDFGGRAVLDMDPENYAIFSELVNRMVSPKLGGVRFVDPAKAAQAEAIRDDERTPKQLALDGFMQLIIAGADSDDSMLLGSGAPVIRITVAAAALETGVGLARIDGQPAPISLDTARRLLCAGSHTQVTIDAFGNILEPLDGEHRLFTNKQGDAMAVKFGGCMDPNCDRPPS
jgi:hypothetical protein